MKVPEKLVPWFLRATGRHRMFLSEGAAREHVEKSARRPLPFGPPQRLGHKVDITMVVRAGWPVYTVAPSGAKPTGSVVYVHGGGWVNEIARQHWRLIAQLAVESRTTVVVPIYPLIPFGTAGQVVPEVVDL